MEHGEYSFAVLMGDLFNFAGRQTKTSPFENDAEEVFEAEEFFKPYSKLIKGAIRGNHELRIVNEFGFDPLKGFCKHLDIPYLGSLAVVRIRVGAREENPKWYHQNYYMAIHHTRGGGGSLGNALNSPTKLEKVVSGCDVYAGGHNHQLATGVGERFIVGPHGPKLMKVHYVSCGSYLDYENSYAEEIMLTPGKLGSPRIRFSGERDHHDVHISI